MNTEQADNDKVIFLAFSNPELERDTVTLIGCRLCKNKTFKIIPAVDEEQFPAMHCAACDCFIGTFGWADNDG